MGKAVVIKMSEAKRADVSERQRDFCKRLIGVGLSRLAITAIMLGKDSEKLTVSDQRAGIRTITSCTEELGYGIRDARNARTKQMVSIVQEIAAESRVRVKIA